MKLLKKFSVLTFIALSVVFTSCSKDDDDSSPSIIGTWELVKSEYNIYSNGGLKDIVEEGDGTENVTFYSNMTGTDMDGTTFVWKLEGTAMTLTSKDEDGEESSSTGEIQKLTDKELVLYSTHKDGDNEFYYRDTFKRK